MSAPVQTASPHDGTPRRTRLEATARSEWIKFRSVRSGPAVLVATALVILLGAWWVSASYRSGWAQMSAGSKASFDSVFTSLRAIELAQLLVGALGVMTVTGEYTSGLIRGTFIATPQRVQVLVTKALVFAAVMWVWCTLLSFVAFFIGTGVLTSPVPHVGIGDRGVLTAVFGGGLFLTLIGLFGLFIGILVRRTAAALAALFGILGVLPLIVTMLSGEVAERLGEYLPSNAGEQIYRIVHGRYDLGPWQGFGLLTAYVTATAVAALIVVRRRDA